VLSASLHLALARCLLSLKLAAEAGKIFIPRAPPAPGHHREHTTTS
jgi:hypothetical protein